MKFYFYNFYFGLNGKKYHIHDLLNIIYILNNHILLSFFNHWLNILFPPLIIRLRLKVLCRWIYIVQFLLLILVLRIHWQHLLVLASVILLHLIGLLVVILLLIILVVIVIISLLSQILFSLIHVLKIVENWLIFWSIFENL